MSKPPKLPELFCTSQRLSLLHPELIRPPHTVKDCLSGDRFWDERHAGRGGEQLTGEDPWRPLGRRELVDGLTAKGRIKRLAVVCAGGYGKTANLEYLEGELTKAGQVAFRFELDEKTWLLPGSARPFWEETLPDLFSQADNAPLTRDNAARILGRCRAAARLVLLFDSIDQATPTALALVGQLLSDPAWYGCPVVLSARPHAVYDKWALLIKPDVSQWRFLRIEPVGEDERQLLLGPNRYVSAQDSRQEERRAEGAALYRQLPESGRELMTNPRNIEFTRRMAGYGVPLRGEQYRLEGMRTAADLFAGSVDYTVRLGAKATGAERLGEKRNLEKLNDRVDFALDLLAAFAYVMYARLYDMPAPGGADGPFRPNVSAIPHAAMGRVRARVTRLLKDADLVEPDYTPAYLEKVDQPALNALNAGVQYDLLDKDEQATTPFRWHDRTLQEFLAAWWLARYATEDDCARLRGWRYDNRMETEKGLYAPLWEFLVEMPKAVRREMWFKAVGVLLEHRVRRCCEMICKVWPTLEQSDPGRKLIADWRAEFDVLRQSNPTAAKLQDDLVMVSPAEGSVSGAFRMGRSPVTNVEYELFDPDHWRWAEWSPDGELARRRHPLAIASGSDRADDDCPVVLVTWYEAACFAAWCGCGLPTESQWEYVGRSGKNAECYFDGEDCKDQMRDRAWTHETSAGHTHPVSGLLANLFGLHDLYGNVWEWCGELESPAKPSRPLRGGSWDTPADACWSAYRHSDRPDNWYLTRGFRLVAPPPPDE